MALTAGGSTWAACRFDTSALAKGIWLVPIRVAKLAETAIEYPFGSEFLTDPRATAGRFPLNGTFKD
jgi:hypothetical protein